MESARCSAGKRCHAGRHVLSPDTYQRGPSFGPDQLSELALAGASSASAAPRSGPVGRPVQLIISSADPTAGVRLTVRA